MADESYDINQYTDAQLYSILDMNNPTDRELEAKIIHLINKYENMQTESGDKLAFFFHNIYNHFFNDDETEGFENPSNNTKEDSKANDDTTNEGIDIKSNPDKISTKPLGYESQQITSVQQFDYSPDKLQLNPILKQTIKRIISIDSQYRDIKTNPLTTSFSFDLSEPLKDVVSLKLYSVQIPYTWYTIPKSYGSNFVYLKGATSGINDGHHDYKIAIKPGNYTPSELETAINERFYDISNNTPIQMLTYDMNDIASASDVNFFSNKTYSKLITYTPNTSKMTFNIDLQKTYTEAYYQLYFPNWTSPVSDPIGSIASYMGFNNQTYNSCSIVSNQTIYSTQTILNEITQDYTLNSSNNYFTVKVYSNNIVNKSYKILLKTIDGNEYIGLASRSEIITSINNTIKSYKINSDNLFETASGITQIDILNNNMINYGNRYYKLTIILNRYIVKYIPNIKIVLEFPTETVILGDLVYNYTIWTYNTFALHNCFFFDSSINYISQLISESSAVASSYIVDTSTNILFTCKTPNYTGGNNDFDLNITPGLYTLNGFTNEITSAFSKYSDINNSLTKFYTAGINKGAYIDEVTSKFTLTIDMEKKFTTPYYHITFDKTSLLSGIKKDGTTSFNYNVGNAWTQDTDLSNNTSFGHQMYSITTSYYIDSSYIFTIIPNRNNVTDIGNQSAPDVNVYLLQPIPVSGFKYIEDYVSAINSSIIGTSIDGQNVLAGSSFTAKYNESSKYYDISLNINYNYSLTERNYDISFIDHNFPIVSTDNIWNKFDISSNYDLSISDYYTQSNGAYATIIGRTSVSGDEIDIKSGSNIIILKTNSLSQYSIPTDTITLEIPVKKYTINSLYNAINTLFNNNSKLIGSQITQLQVGPKIYTKIKLNINNIYTSKDYNIVFYDPSSFVKCYTGSRGVQNTTWDSTLGWMLGFRDYTQYSLILSNKNDTLYLTSFNGAYTYNENTDTKTVIITLEGDTTVSTNLYTYFLISLDDYIQNHLNDGLVTITRKETSVSTPGYSNATTRICDPVTNTLVNTSVQQSNNNNVTNKQLYSLNQSIYSQQNTTKTYSPGPFIKDLFGFIPIKPPSKNGDYYIEFGGSLQNQERLYFGPVNIRKMTIQLLNDRGDVVDLNNTNWSFSFICEQLYRASSS